LLDFRLGSAILWSRASYKNTKRNNDFNLGDFRLESGNWEVMATNLPKATIRVRRIEELQQAQSNEQNDIETVPAVKRARVGRVEITKINKEHLEELRGLVNQRQLGRTSRVPTGPDAGPSTSTQPPKSFLQRLLDAPIPIAPKPTVPTPINMGMSALSVLWYLT
jgi:hypothetical protein